MRRWMSIAVLGALLLLEGCAVLSPYEPPVGNDPYWGKETAFILEEQASPSPVTLNYGFGRIAWWDSNPYPFRSFSFCPGTWWLKDVVGCLYVYDGVKIDATYTTEGWQVYHVDPLRYVYEFKGFREEDDHSEQFAIIWSRELKDTCIWTVMARC